MSRWPGPGTASGEAGANGARRARQWYEEIIGGKRHHDYRGRVIA